MFFAQLRARVGAAVAVIAGSVFVVGVAEAVAGPGVARSGSRPPDRAQVRHHHGPGLHHRHVHRHRGFARHGFGNTATPIKHVIVIIGENHTFDNVFATYRPLGGQRVMNLLSEGIVTASGAPGPAVARAEQQTATDTTTYRVTPQKTGPYGTLPQPNTTSVSPACDGQPENRPDARFPADLANAPYQITKYVPYYDDHGQYSGTCKYNGAYVGDPLHRFYQMYQEIDGGRQDLWTWVHETAGDSNGDPPPSPFGPESTNQGAVDMGFYNVARGDAPALNFLAHHYSMSDNYHQSVMGGTGANHIMLGTGDAAFYQDAHGTPTAPPAGEIENPNPQPGTNNFYTQDGYGKPGTTNGGSYSNCSDRSAPGVAGVFAYLGTLPYTVFRDGDCAPAHYYLLNNYDPGYNVDGSLNTKTFVVPPQHSLPTIGDELSAHHIPWGYFGEGYDNGHPGPNYCNICDPMQYVSSIMTNPTLRANVQHGVDDFDSAAASGTLPAVTFLKPGDDDGHAGYSTLAAFEGFLQHAISEVQNNPRLWRNTAIFVTFDEGGGYYDSGYVQPISFFGDGTRVPMIVVSPYARSGYISHSYTDHVSLLKFIERNWRLGPLSSRSLDNLPDPTSRRNDPYVPVNRPAIGDMFDYFDFTHARAAAAARIPASHLKIEVTRKPEYVPSRLR
jgi:phospholipase C